MKDELNQDMEQGSLFLGCIVALGEYCNTKKSEGGRGGGVVAPFKFFTLFFWFFTLFAVKLILMYDVSIEYLNILFQIWKNEYENICVTMTWVF